MMTAMQTPPKKRDAEVTKTKILKAAQRAFAKVGYTQTGIRDIAQAAGISSPLLIRYFGSKAGLFEAALTDAVNMEGIFNSDQSKLAKMLVGIFQNPDIEITPPAIIALSAGHSDAREIAARVTETHVIAPLANWLGGEQGRAKALEIFMLATSYVMYSRQIPLIDDTHNADQDVINWLEKTIQSVIDR